MMNFIPTSGRFHLFFYRKQKTVCEENKSYGGNYLRLSIEKKPKKIMFTHYDIEVVKLSDKITVNRQAYLANLLYRVCIKIDLKFEHSKKSDIPYLISTLINYQGYTK